MPRERSSVSYREMAEALENMPMPMAVTVSIMFGLDDSMTRTTTFGGGFDAARAWTQKPQDYSNEVAYSASKDVLRIMRERAIQRVMEGPSATGQEGS